MRIKLLVVSVALGLLPTPATYGQVSIPPGYEVIRISEDPNPNSRLHINDHRQIVYDSKVNGTDLSGEIFLYDDRTGQTIRLTDDNVEDRLPDIADDGTIVWSRFMGPDGRFGPTSEIMIRTPDGVISRLTNNDMNDWSPKVNSRGHVTWAGEMGRSRCNDGPIGDIFFYDGSEITAITTDAIRDDVYNQVPELNGRDQIVWVRFDFCAQPDWDSQIRMYHNGVTTTLTDGQIQPNAPHINNGGTVAWVHSALPNLNRETQLWRDGKTSVLTSWGAPTSINDAGHVALMRWHNDSENWHVWLYRDDAFWRLTDGPLFGMNGQLNGLGEVVWIIGPIEHRDLRYMRRFRIGDVNCDRVVDAFDIEPFLLALFDPDAYRQAHPTCDALLADIDQDGSVNAFDIEPFINLLFP